MINVSNSYKELVKSRIRPKIEPEIKISGTDAQGNNIEIVWTGKNITNLKYKRGIDPVGRELPFMELTWTEVYTGNLNEENFPDKYNNIGQYMAVELSFYQDLSFFNNWKSIFDSNKTWKDIFSASWKDLKNKTLKEKITLPNLFLSAKPIYKNKTITWVARDILSFLNENQIKTFSFPINFVNPIRYFLLNEKANFVSNKQMLDAIRESDYNIKQFGETKNEEIENQVIFSGATKDLISQHIQTHNYYLDFSMNGIKAVDLSEGAETDLHFVNELMKEFPEIENNPSVSSYCFKSYKAEKMTEKKYTKLPSEEYTIMGYPAYKVIYDGYGESDGNPEINYAFLTHYDELEVTPINWVSQDNVFVEGVVGETYNEDNPSNTYTSNTDWGRKRFNYLKNYFNNSKSLKFKYLSNLAVETGDKVFVETNVYKSNGEKIITKGIVVQTEIEYDGVVKQSFIIHGTEDI